MPSGPGKYDDACTQARMIAEADTIVLIVLDGKYGAGFSVQTKDPAIVRQLPGLLRDVANKMEAAELRRGAAG